MSEYKFKQADFDNPSFLFVLENNLVELLAGNYVYGSYIKTLGLKGNESVLDFGCGGGTGAKFILNFLNNGGHLTCVEPSSFWLNKAKKRLANFSNVEFKQGKIGDVEIQNASFDVISVMHVIHDIPPADRQDTVNILVPKLKKDGTIFIREPIKKSHGMAVSEIQSLLTTAGLVEVEQTTSKSEYRGKFQFNL